MADRISGYQPPAAPIVGISADSEGFLDTIEAIGRSIREMDERFLRALADSTPRSERFPEDHHCPRGVESGSSGLAIWTKGETCNFCGSMHPAVVMERLEDGSIELGTTGKNYKAYLHPVEGSPRCLRCGRADDCPGGNDPAAWKWETEETDFGKFYFQHFSREQQVRFVELLNAGKIRFKGGLRFNPLPYFIERS